MLSKFISNIIGVNFESTFNRSTAMYTEIKSIADTSANY